MRNPETNRQVDDAKCQVGNAERERMEPGNGKDPAIKKAPSGLRNPPCQNRRFSRITWLHGLLHAK